MLYSWVFYNMRISCVFLCLDTSLFSLERTRNFCSFQVTRFVMGNLFIKMKSILLEILCKVLTELCLYIYLKSSSHNMFFLIFQVKLFKIN